MSNYLRRMLYAGYWLLVAFAFTYSGYCYFRAHDSSSPRDVVVSSSPAPSPEGSSALGASPESQEQGQIVEPSEPAEAVPAEPLLAAPTVALHEAAENAEPAAASSAELSPSVEEPASLPERALPVSGDSQELSGEASVSPAPEPSVADASEAEVAQDAQFVQASQNIQGSQDSQDSESAAPPVASDSGAAGDSESHSQGKEELGYELGQISIGEIRVGYRTPGTNPEGGDGQDESVFEKEPHYVFTLRQAKEDGSLCTARLLRPWRWLLQVPMRERRLTDDHEIDAVDVAVDELNPYPWLEPHTIDVWLDLASFGCEGWAEIVEVKRFNDYRPGPGNLVTGTFEHTVDNLVNLCVEGQDKPIGCTPNHPFWSADREEFVEAGELLFGERVTLLNGETKRVLQRLPRPGPEKVYNLEVFGEHVYHVTSDGILVHNDCVYFAFKDGKVAYVGRTNNFPRRAYEQAKYNHREITPVFFLNNLTPDEARVIEDLFIRNFGLQNLDNKINGIAKSKRMRNNFSSIREKWIDSLSQKYNINLEAGAMDEMQREYPSEINDIIKSLLNIP